MLSHLNYWSNCHDAIDLFDNPMYFRTLLILPVDHSFAHTVGLYTAMICGISLYFVDSRGGGIATLRNIPINLQESNPIFLLTVPSLSGNFMKRLSRRLKKKVVLLREFLNMGLRREFSGMVMAITSPHLRIDSRRFFHILWQNSLCLIK